MEKIPTGNTVPAELINRARELARASIMAIKVEGQGRIPVGGSSTEIQKTIQSFLSDNDKFAEQLQLEVEKFEAHFEKTLLG